MRAPARQKKPAKRVSPEVAAPTQLAPTQHEISDFFTAARRLRSFYRGTMLLVGTEMLLESWMSSATYTKGLPWLAKSLGVTRRTVQRFIVKATKKKHLARQVRKHPWDDSIVPSAKNGWAGLGLDFAWRAPIATPVAVATSSGNSSDSGATDRGGAATAATSASARRRIPTLAGADSPSSSATSASARRRTPIQAAEGSPDAPPPAAFVRAAIDAGDPGEPDAVGNLTPDEAYELVVDAYRTQIQERYGARAKVRRNKEEKKRHLVAYSVYELSITCKMSFARAAELVVAMFLATESKGKLRDEYPLGYLPDEIDDLVDAVREDLNRDAQRRALREHQAVKEGDRKAELAAALAAAGVAGDEGGLDLDAMGYGRVDNDEAAA